MSNKTICSNKNTTYLAPLAGTFLGFLLGISGISNHLIFEGSEILLKTKLTSETTRYTELSFTGFRTLFLTYVGLYAGLLTSSILSRQKFQQNK
jgi:hypothetical protein